MLPELIADPERPGGLIDARRGWRVVPGLRVGCFQKPPEGHVRRCMRAKSRTLPAQQCKNWAVRGSSYCHFHNGRRWRKGRSLSNGKHVSFFRAKLGPTLRQRLAELAETTPDERVSLLEEADLMRETALRALRIFEATCVDPDTSTRASDELKAEATATAQRALERVTEIVLKAAKVRALNESTYDVEQLDYFVHQVGKILNEELGDTPELRRVVDKLQAIRLPGRSRAEAQAGDAREKAAYVRAALAAADETVPERPVEGA